MDLTTENTSPSSRRRRASKLRAMITPEVEATSATAPERSLILSCGRQGTPLALQWMRFAMPALEVLGEFAEAISERLSAKREESLEAKACEELERRCA